MRHCGECAIKIERENLDSRERQRDRHTDRQTEKERWIESFNEIVSISKQKKKELVRLRVRESKCQDNRERVDEVEK
jgi:hypothetical protein